MWINHFPNNNDNTKLNLSHTLHEQVASSVPFLVKKQYLEDFLGEIKINIAHFISQISPVKAQQPCMLTVQQAPQTPDRVLLKTTIYL